MPELPEVETIVRELKSSVIGKKIKNVSGNVQVLETVNGCLVGNVVRRGKFIIFILSDAKRLVVHLRMTGRLMWEMEAGREKYVRAVISFLDGTNLFFSDVRKFGKVWICSEEDYQERTGISRLGVEPFVIKSKDFCELLGERRGVLKNSLLRQDLVAGIGNIYADEICFRTGLHPKSRLEKVSERKIKELYESVQICLKEGIKHCGVSVSDFVGTKGDLGKHQKYLKVYGRKGDPCYKCKSEIEKTVVAGRGTFFCPKCQKY